MKGIFVANGLGSVSSEAIQVPHPPEDADVKQLVHYGSIVGPALTPGANSIARRLAIEYLKRWHPELLEGDADAGRPRAAP